MSQRSLFDLLPERNPDPAHHPKPLTGGAGHRPPSNTPPPAPPADEPPPEPPADDGLGSRDEGEKLKRKAHERFERTKGEFLNTARRAFLKHALDHGQTTADDVRAAVPLPPGTDPRAFGGVPVPFALANIVRLDGYTKTKRSAGHAREVKVWRLNDPAAALRWLAEHPEPGTNEGGSEVRK